MSPVRDVLRAADPWRHESPSDRDARLRAAWARVHAVTEERREQRARSRAEVDGAMAVPTSWPRPRRRAGWAVAVCAVMAMAGVTLWQRAATPVLAAVRFEVRLAETMATPGLREAPVGAEPRLVYLHDEVVISNDHVAAARVVSGRDVEHFAVEIVFTPEGAGRMIQATSGHVGRPMALLVDGLVTLAPTVRSPISDRARLTGDYTRGEAERIAAGLLVR